MPVKLQTTHQQSHWLFYVPESGTCWLVCLRSMSVFNSPFFFSSVSPSASSTYYINRPEDVSTQFSSNCYIFSCLSVQFSRSVVSNSVTPWTAARQASLSITKSQSLLKLMSIELVMPSNYLILCRPLLLPPSIFPSIRWPKYWSFSFNISPSNEHSGLNSFRMDWLDLLAVQGTLKSLLQHHSSKAPILWRSAFFIVQLSHPYMTTGKTSSL